MYNKIYLLILLTGMLTVSCNNSTEEVSVDAYVGGQIRNPTSKDVILLKDHLPVDTIRLDSENRFSYKIKNVEEGLYLFKHPPSSQVLYLQPGDSLLLRANSLDFPGSVFFSGTGGERNNLLSEMFLLNENNTNLILTYYKMPPDVFVRKTDSIRIEQLNDLRNKNSKTAFSEDFLELAEKTIYYDHYDLKERYTYMVKKYYKDFSKKIAPDFHQYRNNINFNEVSLQTSPSYVRFLENYLINHAMSECAGANLDTNTNDCYDLYDNYNITTRIELIDSLTSLPLVKDHFFSKFGALGILMAKDRDDISSILDLLRKKGFEEDKLQKLEQIGTLQVAYLPGLNVGDVELFDTSGNKKMYKEISSEPTVAFLWSIYSPENHINNHQKIEDLRRKYPAINFIGVNIDSGETSRWINTVRKYNYNLEKEFQLEETRIAKDAFHYYLNKSLFLDPSGDVVFGDAYIGSPQFETRVLELLNQ